MELPPPRLFKYQPYSSRALTALKTRTLWFGRPARLNDPFDCAVPYRFVEATIDDCDRLLATRVGAQWDAIRGDRRYVDERGQATEEFRRALERGGRSAIQGQLSRHADRGVACFSEIHDDTLLWSHYGGGHRGICLEFDTASPWLDKLHKVRYTDEVPSINIVDQWLGDSQQVLWALLTKAKCWSYEREWRAIHAESDKKYCYGVEALTGVYLGAALSSDEKDLICHILHGTPTKIFEMYRSDTSFRLIARAIEYTPYSYSPAK